MNFFGLSGEPLFAVILIQFDFLWYFSPASPEIQVADKWLHYSDACLQLYHSNNACLERETWCA